MTDTSDMEKFLETLSEERREQLMKLPEGKREELLKKLMISSGNMNKMTKKTEKKVSPEESHQKLKSSETIQDIANDTQKRLNEIKKEYEARKQELEAKREKVKQEMRAFEEANRVPPLKLNSNEVSVGEFYKQKLAEKLQEEAQNTTDMVPVQTSQEHSNEIPEETALVVRQSEELQNVEQGLAVRKTMEIQALEPTEIKDRSGKVIYSTLPSHKDPLVLPPHEEEQGQNDDEKKKKDPLALPPHEEEQIQTEQTENIVSQDPVKPVVAEETSGNIVVNATEEEQQEEKEKEPEDWITIKKRFWEEYASQEGYEAEHTANREEDTYACELQKKEEDGTTKSMGTVHYTSETSASISKDADLVMYQGLVKDAATHNWSITFGETLDDKQKALLLAAVLIEQQKQSKTIDIVNAPAINLEADYFKDLPKEAQDALRAEKERQEQQKAKEQNVAGNSETKTTADRINRMRGLGTSAPSSAGTGGNQSENTGNTGATNTNPALNKALAEKNQGR